MAYLYTVTARTRDPILDFKLFFTLPKQYHDPETALTHLYKGAEFRESDITYGHYFPDDGRWYQSTEIGYDLIYRVDNVVEISAETQATLKQLKVV